MQGKLSWTCKIAGMLLVALVLVTGCSTPTPSPQPTISPLSSPEPPEPKPVAFASVLPTPDSNWATVTGKLVSTTDRKPVVGVMVFLERTPVPPMLYAPPNTQPRAVTNEGGDFVISEVPDGEYVAVLYMPPYELQVITRPDGDQPLLITAQTGEVADVGTVRVSSFQLPK